MKVIIIGGGWAGCSAAVTASKAGAKVEIFEKTDMLLGLGNVGGIMRNNGRFTASEELIALGAGELIQITDNNSRHRNIDFPGHKHPRFIKMQKGAMLLLSKSLLCFPIHPRLFFLLNLQELSVFLKWDFHAVL